MEKKSGGIKAFLFGHCSIIFFALALFLLLYRYLYVIGFDDITTAVLSFAAVLGIVCLSKDRLSLKSTGKKMRFPVFVCAFGLMCVTQLLSGFCYDGIEALLNAGGLTMYGDSSVVQMRQIIPEETFRLFNALYPILFGPIIEELVYRSYGAEAFRKSGGKVFAILLSGIAFAIGHGSVAQCLHTFFAGAIFAFVLFEYGFVWACVLHVLNNFVIVGADMLLCALLGTENGVLAGDGLSLLLGIVSVCICLKRRKEIKSYISENTPAKGEYPRAFLNLGFVLFLLFNILKAAGKIVPLA